MRRIQVKTHHFGRFFPQGNSTFYIFFKIHQKSFDDLNFKKIHFSQNCNEFPLFESISVLWNWKVPSGYLYLIGLQFVWLNCALCVVACSLSLFVGCCILFSSLAMDVKERFDDLRKSVIASALSVEPLEKLKDIVQFHSTAKE